MSYTPLDRESLFSTVFRSGPLPWGVWCAILAAMDYAGNVSINPAFLAAQWNISIEEIQKAWDVHTQPDPLSKNQEYEGRRLIPLKNGAWHVVSYLNYRDKVKKESRMQSLRDAQERYREKMEQTGEVK